MWVSEGALYLLWTLLEHTKIGYVLIKLRIVANSMYPSCSVPFVSNKLLLTFSACLKSEKSAMSLSFSAANQYQVAPEIFPNQSLISISFLYVLPFFFFLVSRVFVAILLLSKLYGFFLFLLEAGNSSSTQIRLVF